MVRKGKCSLLEYALYILRNRESKYEANGYHDFKSVAVLYLGKEGVGYRTGIRDMVTGNEDNYYTHY